MDKKSETLEWDLTQGLNDFNIIENSYMILFKTTVEKFSKFNFRKKVF